MPDIIVEHRNERGMGAGIMLGILAVGIVVIVALFFLFGGPGRFVGPGASGQTNVNVPAQSQPQTGPSINVPKQIDVNINQQPVAPAAPAQPAANPQ